MTALLLLVVGTAPPSQMSAELEAAYRAVHRLEDCDGLLQRFPEALESYECYWRAARREKRFDEAEQMLRGMLERDPDNPGPRLFVASIQVDRADERAEQTARRALAGFEAAGDFKGIFWANVVLYFAAYRGGEIREAEAHIAEARKVAESVHDTLLLGEVSLFEGWLAFARADYGLAWLRFKRLEHQVPAGIRPDFRIDVLAGLAEVAVKMGRYRAAMTYYEDELALVRKAEVPGWEADLLRSVADAAARVREPRPYDAGELLTHQQRAVEAAKRSGDRRVEAWALLLVGDNPALPIAERVRALERAQELLATRQHARAGPALATALARARLAQGKQNTAFALIDEAIEEAHEQESPEDIATAWLTRATMRWQTGPRPAAIADTQAALDAPEALRHRQGDAETHTRVLAKYADDYRRLAGYLIDPKRGPVSQEDLGLALQIGERMRARGVLQTLAARADDETSAEAAGPAASIATIQKQLMRAGLSEARRADLLAELERLEAERLVAGVDAGSAGGSHATFASLAQIQSALAPDQVLLAYQLERPSVLRDPAERSGSWLLAISRHDGRAFALPERERLDADTEMFLGLVRRRDNSEVRGAAVLYSHLLADALAELPNARRLLIVPDGPLGRVPFAALRPEPDALPLGATLRIAVAPSATLWLQWRRQTSTPRGSAVLALADPRLPTAVDDDDERSAGIFRHGLRLGRLPFARLEAEAVVDSLGSGTLLVGRAASERSVKTTHLQQYGLLHIAAHAIVDVESPQRSAVVLSAGDEKEDGLLQAPEIERLDLNGMAVLLSTCSATGGAVREGEGVMSLARSFFQAGARAVVGNLWPLRDAEAAELVGDIAEHLGRGATLDDAVFRARRDWIAAGRPTAAWGGLQLQGDGSIAWAPPARSRNAWLPFVAASALIGSAGLALLWRRRRAAGRV